MYCLLCGVPFGLGCFLGGYWFWVLSFGSWVLCVVCFVVCISGSGLLVSSFRFTVRMHGAGFLDFGLSLGVWNLIFGFRPHELHVERPDHAVPVGVPLDGQSRFTKPRGARSRGVPRKALVRREVEARQRLWGLRVRATQTPRP
jgi:hypothetical protein